MNSRPLIRIVDDDPELLQSQKMLLETLGWEVVTYSSGTDFLRLDALERPGCLVLDVRMPGMTGLEVQEQLEKTADILSRIRTAFLSEQQALLQNDSIGLGGDIGALDALLKMQGHPERQD